MDAQWKWLLRRLKRSAWLLARAETRGDMLRFIAVHTGGFAVAHARGFARSAIRGRS